MSEFKNAGPVQSGRAYSFDGSDDYINVGTPIIDLESTNEYTISMHVKKNNSSTHYFIDKQQAGYKGFYVYNNSTEFCAGVPAGGSSRNESCSVGATIADGKFKHIAVTYDGSSQKFYKNGQLLNSVNKSVNILNSTSELHIGKYNGASSYYMNGQMNDVRIFNRAVSSGEVTEIYNNETITS